MGARVVRKPSNEDRGRLLAWIPSRTTLLAGISLVTVVYLATSQLYFGSSGHGGQPAGLHRSTANASLTVTISAQIDGGYATTGGPTCDDLLHIPKVALLFLTPGKLPHERLWREWLEGAAGLLPIPAVQRYAAASLGLRAEKLREIQAACMPAFMDRSRPVADRQFLFTVYVHTHPAFRGYRNFSMFHGRIIPQRIVAKRGQHSLTDAERLLLVEALREPLNQQFLLISETTAPLYPAAVIWEQVLAENISRMDACNYKTDRVGNLERWTDKMETTHFKKHHWRKTSQWFSTPRRHAQLIVDDVEINDAFEKFCFSYYDHVRKRNVSCSSNEHYTAIVLAVHGLEHETTCNGMGTTHVDWTKMNKEGRPRSFRKREIRDRLVYFARTRSCSIIETDKAISTASKRFVSAAALPVGSLLPRLSAPKYAAFNSNCSLLIRKFPAETAAVAREVLRKFIKLPDH